MVTKAYIFVIFLLCGCICGCSDEDEAVRAGADITEPVDEAPEPTGVCEGELQVAGESLSLAIIGDIRLSSSVELVCSATRAECCDMGAVDRLGSLSHLPETGWSASAVLHVGHGYLFRRMVDGTVYYARLYVKDSVTDADGNASLFRFTYQSPIQSLIQPDQTVLSFDAARSRREVLFRVPTFVEVASCPEWCTVDSRYGSMTVEVRQNPTSREYVGEIVLCNSEGESRIRVTQSASLSPSFSGGRGTEQDPYTIRTARELDELRNWGCGRTRTYFEVTEDIDLSSYLSGLVSGWDPIGYSGAPFFGKVKGNGHRITGLWMASPSGGDWGFWGTVKNSDISGLRFELADRGVVVRDGAVLCGYAIGTVNIIRCSVQGNITATGCAGGILCRIEDKAEVLVSECYVEGRIKGRIIGGICAQTGSKPVVTNSYSRVHFSSIGPYYELNLSKPMATVSGIGAYARCSYCYAVSSVEAEGEPNLIAEISRYNMHCYYDKEVMQRGSDEQNGMTTEEMKRRSTYEGWDFENVWQIEEGVSYPTLRCFNE